MRATEAARLRLGKHFEDGLPGFMSRMRRRRKSGGALGNTSGAGSGGALVGSGKSSFRASSVAKCGDQTLSHQHQQPVPGQHEGQWNDMVRVNNSASLP